VSEDRTIKYDLTKFREKYDEELIDSFLAHFDTEVVETGPSQILVRRNVDSLTNKTLYSVVQACYVKETDTFRTDSNFYAKAPAEYFMKLFKEVREGFDEMIDFLEKECRISEIKV
jgi:hypothetical protein